MRLLHRVATGALCLAFSTIASGAGTLRIVSRAGSCELTAPSDWKVDKLIESSASSADDSVSVVISTARRVRAMSEVKPIIEGTLKPLKMFEDSPQRRWYAYEGNHGQVGAWYVGVPGKAGVCGAQIVFKHAADAALAKQIALSVKPAG